MIALIKTVESSRYYFEFGLSLVCFSTHGLHCIIFTFCWLKSHQFHLVTRSVASFTCVLRIIHPSSSLQQENSWHNFSQDSLLCFYIFNHSSLHLEFGLPLICFSIHGLHYIIFHRSKSPITVTSLLVFLSDSLFFVWFTHQVPL